MDKPEQLRVVSAQVPASDVARLAEQAAANDRTVSAEIRRLIRGYLDKDKADERKS
jgi:hypothetical protein